MDTPFNFKSQICTTREQSERLIALGLKKETADMVMDRDGMCFNPLPIDMAELCNNSRIFFPAWSLHRLMCMYQHEGDEDVYLRLRLVFSYDDIIDQIEYDIKEGYFNKEYLEETL